MVKRPLLLLLIFAVVASACQSDPAGPTAERDQSARAVTSPAADKPLAYVAGEPVRTGDLLTPLIEAAGGQVMAEHVLGQLIDRRLAERGLTLSDADLAAERERVLATLDPADPDQAVRLLRELRQRRNLGEQRFAAMLRRNAGLRKLVQDEVELTDEALRQAYQLAHGPRYRTRILVVDSLQEAARLRQRIERGESFTDLAVEHSTDPSSAQGGLLPLISPADPTYPQVILETLGRLDAAAGEEGEALSEVVALDGAFALLRLERKIAGDPVEFDDVKAELAEQVRRRLEGVRMQQLARRLLADAKVTVLEPALAESWGQQKQLLLNP